MAASWSLEPLLRQEYNAGVGAMILGLGVDLFEVSRMELALRSGDAGFTESLFTSNEIAWCERQRRPAEHYAVRLAVKEATFKAFGLPDDSGVGWKDIEMVLDARGTPSLVLHRRLKLLAEHLGVARVLTSTTRTHALAAAAAVLES